MANLRSAPFTIPQDEYDTRVKQLMEKLVKTEKTQYASETDELFRLYNDRNLPQENGKSCGMCRARVFKRMKSYYETLIKEE